MKLNVKCTFLFFYSSHPLTHTLLAFLLIAVFPIFIYLQCDLSIPNGRATSRVHCISSTGSAPQLCCSGWWWSHHALCGTRAHPRPHMHTTNQSGFRLQRWRRSWGSSLRSPDSTVCMYVFICFHILFVLYIIKLYTQLILVCTLGWVELTVTPYTHCKTIQELPWGRLGVTLTRALYP